MIHILLQLRAYNHLQGYLFCNSLFRIFQNFMISSSASLLPVRIGKLSVPPPPLPPLLRDAETRGDCAGEGDEVRGDGRGEGADVVREGSGTS